MVVSAAVEETIPDVEAAKRVGATLRLRADLLAELFNAAETSVGVAGTSGKSTTTGMIGWILVAAGRDPTMINGAEMKNFATPDAPFASAVVGSADLFVAEVDESDGSIALYRPTVAVVNNISASTTSRWTSCASLFGGLRGQGASRPCSISTTPRPPPWPSDLPRDGDDLSPTASTAGRGPQRLGGAAAAPAASASPSASSAARAPRSSCRPPAATTSPTPWPRSPRRGRCGVSLGQAAAALGAFQGVRRRMDVVGRPAASP